jgi:bifunctional DNA-binding transcriptional regulator/antitoxin component of YhaV-PrlF toxin-antitoxin module
LREKRGTRPVFSDQIGQIKKVRIDFAYQLAHTILSPKQLMNAGGAPMSKRPIAKMPMEVVPDEHGSFTPPREASEALGLAEGTKLSVRVDKGSVILRRDMAAAIKRLRGIYTLPSGKSTDGIMFELRGRRMTGNHKQSPV